MFERWKRWPIGATLTALLALSAAGAVRAQTGTPCNVYQSGSASPAGYGAAWNVLSRAKELLVTSVCTGKSVTQTVGSGASNQYVYDTYYYFSNSQQRWVAQKLSGQYVKGSEDWLLGKGTLTGARPTSQLLWVGYVCQWNGSAWKCGCRDAACATNHWQLQAVEAMDAGGGGDIGSGSQVRECSDPKTVNVTPSNVRSVLEQHSKNASTNVVLSFTPGSYPAMTVSGPMKCLTMRCTAIGACKMPARTGIILNAWKSGLPGADNRFGTVIIEGFTVARTLSACDSGTTSCGYGIAVYGVDALRIKDNTFNGVYNHDISTKEAVKYAEILNNTFIKCARHCIEIGQNGNVASRPSTSGTMIVRGNVFDAPLTNALTQRYNRKLIVEGNTFKNLDGRAVHNWPFWKLYYYGQAGGAEPNLIPMPSLRTEIVGNSFSGKTMLEFEGRGATDDTVLIKGNTGSVSCKRIPMDADTAAAHANEQTTAPPKLDPASDVSC